MTEPEAVLFLIDAFPGIRVTHCPASVRRDVLALAERRGRG